MPLYYVREIDENNCVILDDYNFVFYHLNELIEFLRVCYLDRTDIECYSLKRGYQPVFIYDDKVHVGTFEPVSIPGGFKTHYKDK